LYALGALLATRVHTRLTSSARGLPRLLAELEQFDQIVGCWATAAAPVGPPAYLRDLLTLRIEREAWEAPLRHRPWLPFPEKAGAIHRKPAPKPSPTSVLLPWVAAAGS